MENKLTIEERQRFWKAIDNFESTTKKLDEIYTVIVGNEKFGQEGLVFRLAKLESDVEAMQKEITKAKGWLAGALAIGGVAGSVITLFIKYLITKI